MALQPIPVESFGGLNLIDDPGTVGWGGAIDLLNVDFVLGGRLRSRPGWYSVATTTATPSCLFYSIGLGHTLATEGTNLRAYNAAGTNLATQANVTSGDTDSVAYYTPTTSKVYTVSYGASGHVAWDGSSFVNTGGLTAKSVAVTPWDNRLVRARTSANATRVMFSDAGDPVTFGANNYVDLAPGAGPVEGIRTWGNLLFAFKRDRFFVFFGTSTDSSGNPVFNYRMVAGEAGLAYTNAAVAGREGVYFVGQDGIYLTTGGDPRKISKAIDPLFRAETPAFYTASNPASFSSPFVGYSDGALWVSFTDASAARRVLVYRANLDAWTVYDLPAAGLSGIPNGMLFANNGTTKIGEHDFSFNASNTTDDGGAITSRYRSGFSDLGTPHMKRMHSWRLQGSSSPTLKLSQDFGALETGAAVTLGTAPAVAEATRRYAPRGRQFSWQLSGTSAWSVNSLVGNLASVRKGAEHVAA